MTHKTEINTYKFHGWTRFVILLVMITITGAVNAETGKIPDPRSAGMGEILYKKHCQVCHQKDGVGEPPVPLGIRRPDFSPAMPLNETSHAWHHSDEHLVKMILEGLGNKSRMPAWKQVLSEKQARDLVAYIKSLWSARIIACQGPKHMSCM